MMDQDIVDVVMRKMMKKKLGSKQGSDSGSDAGKSRSAGSSQNIPLPAPIYEQSPREAVSGLQAESNFLQPGGPHFMRKHLSSIEEEMTQSRYSSQHPQQFAESMDHLHYLQSQPQMQQPNSGFFASDQPSRESSSIKNDYSHKNYVSSSSNLSAQESKLDTSHCAEAPPMTTTQQYELNMLELKKMKLMEKIANLESRIQESSQGVTHKQVELTSLVQSCEEQLDHKHFLMSEFARMEEVSRQRIEEVTADLKESEEEAARVAKSFQDQQREDQKATQDRLNALEDQYRTEIEQKERVVQELETDIARDSEQIQLCRERMTYLNDNIKNIMIERVREFSKLEKATCDNEEKSLSLQVSEEETKLLQLQELEANCKQALSVGVTSIEQQRAKAEKIIQSLKQTFDKLLPEFKRHRLEFEQLAQKEEQVRQTIQAVSIDTADLKQAHLEIVEAVELLPGYLAERSRRKGQLPFSTNKALNMIISLDNIYLSEIEDFEQQVGKLGQKQQQLAQEQSKFTLRTQELRARIDKDRDRLRSVFAQSQLQENPPAAATN